MGNLQSLYSGGDAAPEPPRVVLVPPLFERDYKGRSRMAKSSYDTGFNKLRMKWLFNEYLLPKSTCVRVDWVVGGLLSGWSCGHAA